MTKPTMSISRASGKAVVTMHGDVDAEILRRTLTDLVEDQGNLHLIIDLRDAGPLNHDNVNALIGSAQRVRRAGGDLVLTTPPPAVNDALHDSGFKIAQSGPAWFNGHARGPVLYLPDRLSTMSPCTDGSSDFLPSCSTPPGPTGIPAVTARRWTRPT